MAKKEVEMNEDEMLDDAGSELRVYELGFHVDPELPVEEVKKVYHALRELIEKDSTLVAEGEPEKIQLSYTISRQETMGRRDFSTAYFSWIVYETSASSHAKIVEAAGANAHLVRFIDLLTTKDAARHASEMHELFRKVPEEHVKDSEAALNVELDTALEHAVV